MIIWCDTAFMKKSNIPNQKIQQPKLKCKNKQFLQFHITVIPQTSTLAISRLFFHSLQDKFKSTIPTKF